MATKKAGGEKQILVTKEGLKKLQEELKNLKEVKRHEVADRLKEAISYGDLSENSEYEEAKNEQAFVEGRILELESQIKNAEVISDKHKTKGVELGVTVTLDNLSEKGKETYTIVGTTEADPFEGKISNESPVGMALLGKAKGAEVKVVTPGGDVKYKILEIK